MKALALFLGGIFALAVASGEALADAVQWRAADGGNDHWYELQTSPSPVSWTTAHGSALNRGGYLATVTSAPENAFIFTHLMSGASVPGVYGPWLGASQANGSAEPAGGWGWYDTNEAPVYGNWAGGEPNNGGGSWQENRLGFNGPTHANWLDLPDDGANSVYSWIVEYESDPYSLADRWRITDLGTLGGSSSEALAINDRRQVVGYSYTPGDGAIHAFLFADGVMTDLGTLGGADSFATAINASGQIVGWSDVAGGGQHAFLWSEGVMIDLGTLDGGEEGSEATAINANGQVVGWSYVADGTYHAFLWSDGVMTDLGTLGGAFSEAWGIDDSGRVVGSAHYSTSSGYGHAFLYADGAMTDLGTLGGPDSQARAISDHGQIVGWSPIAHGSNHAFLYADGHMTDLGTLGGASSFGAAISATGHVVGDSLPISGTRRRAFLYSGGAMTDLERLLRSGSGWALGYARGINANDAIVGSGTIGGYLRAYLLEPYGLTVDTADRTTVEGDDVELSIMLGSRDGRAIGNYEVIVDWGDVESSTLRGSTTSASVALTGHHRYGDNGVYSVLLSVTADLDGGVSAASSASATVQVANRAPEITEVPLSARTRVGIEKELTISYRDGGRLDAHVFRFDFDDGSAAQYVPGSGRVSTGEDVHGVASATHTFTDPGDYGVTASVLDDDGAVVVRTFIVHVVLDDTPPMVTCPGDATVEATSGAGATVTLSGATASDAVDPTPSISYAPASESTFPIGTTEVTVTATDDDGNADTCIFRVTVQDTTPPTLACPGDVTLEATGASGAVATFAATATDAVNASPTITYSEAPGSTFPIGTTTVTVTATDGAGNAATATFTVTVVDTTAPVISGGPGSVSAELMGTTGAMVIRWDDLRPLVATDAVDGVVPVICSPPSGSSFSLGTTRVRCTATDAHGNVGTFSFFVWIYDFTAPTITVPASLTLEATSASGAVANFSATASDFSSGGAPTAPPAISVSKASGTTFPIGTTTVTVTATDGAGNAATATFTVTVVDTTAPAISGGPGSISAEAHSAAGTAITWASPTASDLVDGAVTVTCSPASGSTFAPGTTTVTCIATDARGNSASSSFLVWIYDSTPPTLVCPADITIPATSSAGAVVTFSATATDIVDPAPTISFSPASGSTLAIGTTTITCTARDAAGNSTSCTFRVTVEGGAAESASLADVLAALPPSGSTTTDIAIQNAIVSLDASADPTLWIDGTHVTASGGKTVFSNQESAIKTLAKITNPDSLVMQVILATVAIDQLLAQTAVSDATARGGNAKTIAKAQKSLDAGRTAEAAGDYFKAANAYEAAWKTAGGA